MFSLVRFTDGSLLVVPSVEIKQRGSKTFITDKKISVLLRGAKDVLLNVLAQLSGCKIQINFQDQVYFLQKASEVDASMYTQSEIILSSDLPPVDNEVILTEKSAEVHQNNNELEDGSKSKSRYHMSSLPSIGDSIARKTITQYENINEEIIRPTSAAEEKEFMYTQSEIDTQSEVVLSSDLPYVENEVIQTEISFEVHQKNNELEDRSKSKSRYIISPSPSIGDSVAGKTITQHENINKEIIHSTSAAEEEKEFMMYTQSEIDTHSEVVLSSDLLPVENEVIQTEISTEVHQNNNELGNQTKRESRYYISPTSSIGDSVSEKTVTHKNINEELIRPTSVDNSFTDFSLSEDEYIPTESDFSSDDDVDSDVFSENVEQKYKSVKRALFIDKPTDAGTKNNDEKLKRLKLSKSYLPEVALKIIGKHVIVNLSCILHKGTYKGHVVKIKNPDDSFHLKGKFAAKVPIEKHVCEFSLDDGTYSATLSRQDMKCVLETKHCLKLGNVLTGKEIYVSSVKQDITCLTISDIHKNLPLEKRNVKLISSKQHCCTFCGELQTALSRHLRTKHNNEPSVQNLMLMKEHSKERNNSLRKIRLEGDAKYNVKIGKLDPTLRIPVRLPDVHSVAESCYCPGCNGLFGKKNFARHERKCTGRNPTGERVSRKSTTHYSEHDKNKESVEMLLEGLRNDEIGNEIIKDHTIKLLAEHYNYDGGVMAHRKNNARSHLRRFARLLLEVKKIDGSVKKGSDLIRPGKYDTVMDGIRSLCNFSCSSQDQKPKLALQFGPILTNVSNRLLIQYLKNELPPTDPEILRIKNFQEIHKMDFKIQVTRRALIMSTLRKMKKSYELPAVSDIAKFTNYLVERANYFYQSLEENGFNYQIWKQLGEVLLCQIVIFNRRRVGESSRIHITDYESRKKIDEKDYEHLTRLQILLAKRFSVMYIAGKRVRPLPVLLNPIQEKQINMYLKYRSTAGVPEENPYLFGCPGVIGYLSASKLLPHHASKTDAERPDLLRGGILRRQVATMSQFLNLSDNEIQELADFMGHDARVHRQFYRQPHLLLEVTKISRFLSVVGDVHIEEHRGKKIDELEPFIPPADFDEDDICDDGDLVKEYLPKEVGKDLDLDIEPDINCGIIDNSNSEEHQETSKNPGMLTQETTPQTTMEKKSAEQKTPKKTKKQETSKNPGMSPRTTTEQKTPKKTKKQTVGEILNIVRQQASPHAHRKRLVVNRATWSKEEKTFMQKKFKDYLNPNSPLPSKDYCQIILEQNPGKLKSSRTRDNMYAWVQNQRAIKRKKMGQAIA